MFALASLFMSLAVAAAPAPTGHLVIGPCKAGDQQQFRSVSCDIPLQNTGDKPIRILSAEAALPWDSIDQQVVVPPGGASYLKATIATRDAAGYIKRSFRLHTDEPGAYAVRGASVSAFVSTVLDQHAPTLDFGVVRTNEPSKSASISLSSREVADFRILAIESKPDYLEIKLGSDGRTLVATLSNQAPWGLLNDKIGLKINTPIQQEAWVRVRANVIGEIAPGSNPFSFGLMRTNASNEFLLRVTSRSGKSFKIGKTHLDRVKGSTRVVPCVPKADGCQMVRVVVDNGQTIGRLEGHLLIELPEFKRTLPVELVGMLLPPDFKVHDFDKEVAEQAAAGAQSSASAAPGAGAVDLQQAIKQTTRKAHMVPPPGTGPLLRWSVANDGSVHGYIIYRADTEQGPFVRINKELIPVSEEPSKSGELYQWRDNSTTPGRTYWYEIGMVKNSGEKVALTQPQKVVAK